MMRIVPAKKEHSKMISKLMLSDLENPDPKFPQEMVCEFREHAKENSLIKEFENPRLIAFIALDNDALAGFIVGYEEDSDMAIIHYITAGKNEIKEGLLKRFVGECKVRKINKILADTFEFMNNNDFFKSKRFVLAKKENIANNLEMLWYELEL